MSSPRAELSPEARRDLEDIESYIAEHDGEVRAVAITEHIEKAIRNLALMPGMGSRRYYLNRGQRAFSVSPWTIFYEELPGRNGISVVRVVDGRRDLPGIFQKKRR
ncbi:MAG: type II toxin-antitoxin system RelE/ParE family toxin [Rhizomicrobium sp.]